MSEYTEKLLKRLSIIGNASHRLVNAPSVEKKAPAQQLVLDILAEEDGLTQGVLAEILDIRPSSLTEVLSKLEKRGEIKRTEDPNDKRIKQVFITDSGRAKATPESNNIDHSEEFFIGLNEEELAQLDQLLTKITDGWQQELCDLSDFPRTPVEALEILKEFKKQYSEEFIGKDLRDISPEERRHLKREMKRMMRQQFGRQRGRERNFDRRPGEFGPAFRQTQKNETEGNQHHEDDWTDF